jgi:hypothetical protein
MFPLQIDPRPTITPTVAQVGRYISKQTNGRRTRKTVIRLNVTATIAGGPATAIRNRGSIACLFDRVGRSDNGTDVIQLDTRAAVVMSQLMAAGPQTATRATLLANGAYPLVEYIVLYDSFPIQIDGGETAFLERDPSTDLLAWLEWNGNANLLFNLGAATCVFSAVSATVVQQYDDRRGIDVPLFRPWVQRIAQLPITAAVTEQLIRLPSQRWIRGLLIQQDSNIGEVSDILTSFYLMSDTRRLIGPTQITVQDLQRMNEAQFGGFADTNGPGVGGSYAYLDFQPGGRLAQVLDPAQTPNLGMYVTALPSVTAGATSSLINIYSFELERIDGLTAAALPWQKAA